MICHVSVLLFFVASCRDSQLDKRRLLKPSLRLRYSRRWTRAAPWHLVPCSCCWLLAALAARAGDTHSTQFAFGQRSQPSQLLLRTPYCPVNPSRLAAPPEHFLNVLLAVLGRRLQVVQPLPHGVHLGLDLLDLRAQLVLEHRDGDGDKPGR